MTTDAKAFLVAYAVAVAVVVILYLVKRVPSVDSWDVAARKLGLTFQNAALSSPTIEGWFDGVDVLIDTVTKDEATGTKTYTRFVIRTPDIVDGIDLWSQQDIDTKVAVKRSDIQVGDPDFDLELSVVGTPSTLLAALDESTRSEVRRFMAHEGRISAGRIKALVPGKLLTAEAIADQLNEMVAIAARFKERTGDVPRRLAENARGDPLPGVRYQNLRSLVGDRFRHTPEAVAAVEHALGDTEPAVRCLAAMHARSGGREVLDAILAEEGISAKVRSNALAHLIDTVPRSEIAELLARSVGDPSDDMAIPAVIALGAATEWDPMPRLLQVCQSASLAVRLALCDAFARRADPRAEEALLGFLAREDHPGLQARAARALQFAGTINSVESLLPLSKGLLTPADLKEPAREAIHAIRSRLGEVEAGRLSLSAPTADEGAVSIVGEAGALSKVKA